MEKFQLICAERDSKEYGDWWKDMPRHRIWRRDKSRLPTVRPNLIPGGQKTLRSSLRSTEIQKGPKINK